MGFIPEITCRRCGQKYSGLRSRCPSCGTPRPNQPTRVPNTTASATPSTAASRRAGMDIRWQFIFGGILLLAVILAVIVLIASGGSSGSSSSSSVSSNKASSSSSGQSSGSAIVYSAADLPTPSPSPEPTPEASPTPAFETMGIIFNNNTLGTDASFTNAGELSIDLDVSVYPAQDNLEVTWTSTNEKILTVDENGVVTVVGASPNMMVHATIIAECCGVQRYITFYVPAYQAAYLTENLFDAETYEQDNLEWDSIIYATPTPKP